MSERDFEANSNKEEWTLVHAESGERRVLSGVADLKAFISSLEESQKEKWLVYAFGSRVPFRIDGPRLRPMSGFEKLRVIRASEGTESSLLSPRSSFMAGIARSAVLDSADRRKYERFALPLRIILISGNRTFTTYARNISLGGILMAEKPSRDFRHADLKVLIQSPDEKINLEIPAAFAEDSHTEQRRIEYKKLDAEALVKLSLWLQSSNESAGGDRRAA